MFPRSRGAFVSFEALDGRPGRAEQPCAKCVARVGGRCQLEVLEYEQPNRES
jgi:hypothetical protein